MRLLYAGYITDGSSAFERKPGTKRERNSRMDQRQSLSLHGLSKYCRGHSSGREENDSGSKIIVKSLSPLPFRERARVRAKFRATTLTFILSLQMEGEEGSRSLRE